MMGKSLDMAPVNHIDPLTRIALPGELEALRPENEHVLPL